MKIAIRYHSRGGNTKAVAEAIANETGVCALSIDEPLEGPVDLLFVGGGIYASLIDDALKEFLNSLEPGSAKAVAVFISTGMQDKAEQIVTLLKDNKINVKKDYLVVKVGLKNHASLGGKGYIELNKKQTRKIKGFVKSMSG